jgi:hypothetical protein
MSLPNFFDSSEPGAPVLNNVAGSLLSVLRACLKDGFNVRQVLQVSVTAGVATAMCLGHGYSGAYGKLVKLSGVSVPALNGDKHLLSVSTNAFTYDATGVADGVYDTGTMEARRAPLGWTEPYTGTNKAIFARSAPEALAQMLRMVDTEAVASIVRVKGVVSATDVDTFTGDFPSEAQVAGGGYWQKGANNATAKKWFVAGNDRAFYLGTQLATNDQFVVYFFGDGVPYYVGDSGFTLLSGQTNTTYTGTPAWGLAQGSSMVSSPGSSPAIYAPSGVLAGETSPQFQALVNPGGGNTVSGANTWPNPATYPNPVIHPLIHVLSTGPCIRGQIPGLAYVLASTPFSNLQVVQAGADTFLAVSVSNSGQIGQIAIKLNGGWY